nr:LuxR C-terminal-related transcriptional regulator [Ardenticatena sp.]
MTEHELTTLLLATKWRIPPTRETLVVRTRLLDALDHAVQNALTLVSAPAGYGKTTLLAHWARERRQPVAWFTIGETDNEPVRFWAYVAQALRTRWPAVASAMHWLDAPQPFDEQAFVMNVLNILYSLNEPIILVLDDYHLIQQESIHRTLAFWLEHQPPNVHMVIATRSDPPLPLARWRVRNRMTEFRATDLRFTIEEAAAFLNEIMGLHLTDEAIAALEARTAGWVAALHLAALSLQETGDIDRLLDSFEGDHHYIVEYLAQEVLAQQPPDVRHFLLFTAPLDTFTADLCDTVLQRDDSRELLDSLERRNLFIEPLDARREWYRYHPLMQAFLRTLLKRDHPEAVRSIHRRAAYWYAARDMVREAVQHALAAEEWPLAISLMQHAGPPLLLKGEWHTVRTWLERLPETWRTHEPHMALLYAWTMLDPTRRHLLDEQIWHAEQALAQAADLPAEERRPLEGQLEALRAYAALTDGQPGLAVEHAEAALDLLPHDETLLRGLLSLMLTYAYRLQGETDAADQAMAQIERLSRRAEGIPVRLMRAALHLMQGHLRLAAEQFRFLLDQDESPFYRNVAAFGLVQLLYQWNRLDEAETLLHQTLETAGDEMPVLALGLQAMRAFIAQARGQTDEARHRMHLVRQQVAQLPLPPAQRDFQALDVLLALRQGRLDEARAWAASQPDIRQHEYVPTMHELTMLVLVRVHLANHQPDNALLVLEHAMPLSPGLAGRHRIEIRMLRAMALYQKGALTTALDLLEEALRLAAPEEYVRLFLDEGDLMRQMLLAFRRHKPESDTWAFAARLLEAMQTEAPSPDVHLGEPLTEREIEVVRLLAAGLTAPQIAEQLTVAPSTVRTHMKSIYRKLNAHNKVEAVEAARQLGLI